MALAHLLSLAQQPRPDEKAVRNKHFAFVDHQQVFTIEITESNVPILNFVNLTNGEFQLLPRNIVLMAEEKRLPVTFFQIDTGLEGQSITTSSVKVRAYSSFGVALKGDFAGISKLDKVAIRLAKESFELEPMSPTEFDQLALKINKINLKSPDIRDDYRILRIKPLGSRKAGS